MKGKPVIPPVYLTATYKFDKSDDLIDVVQNRAAHYPEIIRDTVLPYILSVTPCP